ncbi:acetylxylan esterase [Arthrobacter sp. PAMC25564]|uniref:acetylxylan esterase n=1 Tax=Arthrobacter sp. PAMC25564 TaxID=2565366 RepID=UPI0010A2976B|nr:acetylxylan esterase [Arthrobacter sp. PAMC25564]QCB96005.1 acetylxylan esterase [Arthrobacter sp. PAMC25564]
MPLFDMPLDQLRAYTSSAVEPEDFDEFWGQTIAEAREFPLDAVYTPVENHLRVIDSFDVSFSGFGGARIKGWLHLPANRDTAGALPVVVQYIGYSGGRGLVQQDTKWAQAGYAHFIMDTRGQGYGGMLGETADPHPSAGEVSYAGLMTRGISAREDYYYRLVFVDAFRAIEAAQSHSEVDAGRVLLVGLSQGGGLAIAAAGLAAGRLDGVLGTMADVPFLQDFPRAIDIAPRGPYPEIAGFLSRHRDRYESMLAVLNYFDGVHLGRRATAPALFSVALMDDVCPPSTVFAAYNAYGAGAAAAPSAAPAKSVVVYRFNNHEGGQEHHWVSQLRYVADLLAC